MVRVVACKEGFYKYYKKAPRINVHFEKYLHVTHVHSTGFKQLFNKVNFKSVEMNIKKLFLPNLCIKNDKFIKKHKWVKMEMIHFAV